MSAPQTADAPTAGTDRIARGGARLRNALSWALAGLVAVLAFAVLALAALAAAVMGLAGAVVSAALPTSPRGRQPAGAPEGWVAEAFGRR